MRKSAVIGEHAIGSGIVQLFLRLVGHQSDGNLVLGESVEGDRIGGCPVSFESKLVVFPIGVFVGHG